MNLDELSMAYSFVHQVLPGTLAVNVACAAWFWFCRWYYRAEERAWREALRRPGSYGAASLDARMSILIAQRGMAGRGSPADRLSFAGMAVGALVGIFALAIYWPQ